MSHQLQDHFENLLDAQVDRREFLAYCGATLLGVFGVSSLLNTLTKTTPTNNRSVSNGYGSNTFGGSR